MGSLSYILKTIEEKIKNAAYFGYYHLDFRTPARFDIGENVIKDIEKAKEILEQHGYKVTVKYFTDTNVINNKAIDVHINWE